MTLIKTQTSLLHKNTMHINVSAAQFISVRDEDELKNALQQKPTDMPLLIMGGGSNMVFLNDFNGLVIEMNNTGIEIVNEDENHVWVKANAGENWHQFVLWTIENNLAGIENLSLIPGKVGASPMQNIGAYGVEIKDVFDSLEAIHITSLEKRIFNKSDCRFGYRESVFKRELKDQFVITSVTYKLQKPPYDLSLKYGAIQRQLQTVNIKKPTIKDVSNAVVAIRESKLPNPKELPNCGSFFKNPTIKNSKFEPLKQKYPDMPGYEIDAEHTKIPAGWLIEKSGWKGKRWGNVGVHDRQALVLVNYNHGTGQEIYDLSEKIKTDVLQRFGIELEREVNVIK